MEVVQRSFTERRSGLKTLSDFKRLFNIATNIGRLKLDHRALP